MLWNTISLVMGRVAGFITIDNIRRVYIIILVQVLRCFVIVEMIKVRSTSAFVDRWVCVDPTNIVGPWSLRPREGVFAQWLVADITSHDEWTSGEMSSMFGHGIIATIPLANLAPAKGAMHDIFVEGIEETSFG